MARFAYADCKAFFSSSRPPLLFFFIKKNDGEEYLPPCVLVSICSYNEEAIFLKFKAE